MFEKLYKYGRVIARHREGPSAYERERYLSHRMEEGAGRASLLHLATELLVIAREIALTGQREIGRDEITAAAIGWARRQRARHRTLSERWSRDLFIVTAIGWLRFLRRLRCEEVEARPFSHRLDDFTRFLVDERGLSAITVRNYCWYASRLLTWLEDKKRPFSEISHADIDDFLVRMGRDGWGRVSLATSAKALRAFFRHAKLRGWCNPCLADAIESPRIFRQENLPLGPAWKDVERLISITSSDVALDIRDRAILMLLAVYGLRSSEVRNLRLEDIDWRREIVVVRRSKQRRVQEYPLTRTVGNTIIRYLKEVRPSSAYREVFLTLKSPIKPLSPGGLYHVTRSRFLKLGIVAQHHGPHALRHACATHLMAEGFNLKEIGDHLGHRSNQATLCYAKVDLAGLRKVAEFDLGGLL